MSAIGQAGLRIGMFVLITSGLLLLVLERVYLHPRFNLHHFGCYLGKMEST